MQLMIEVELIDEASQSLKHHLQLFQFLIGLRLPACQAGRK